MFVLKIDKLIRSHRKTIGLKITQDARLIVQAPYSADEDFIRRLILRKESWIKAKLKYYKERQNKIVVRQFIPGEEFLFLGKNYPLVAVDDLPKAVILGDSLMISKMVLGNAQDHIETWYKTQALEYITQRVKFYAQFTGLKYTSIRVNEATTRWGSCGYKDTLNFTWRLIMAHSQVIDYVVVHELMHLKQRNHSSKFWAEVARVMPDYNQAEKWLKHNSHLLAWD